MWLVENWGVDKFRDAVASRMGDTLSKVRPCYREAIESANPAVLHGFYLSARTWAVAALQRF